MKIAIIGAGAMGSRFGWQLAKNNDNNVVLVDDWDKNILAVQDHGVIAEVNGNKEAVDIPIYSSKKIINSETDFDLIIMFTKSMMLKKTLEKIQPIIHKDTYVLCLLNGLGHDDTLRKYVNKGHIIMGVTMIASQMTGPGRIKFEGNGDIEVQNLSTSSTDKKAILNIIDVFNKANLHAKYSDNVMYSIWRKACVNGVMNTMGALLETNNIGFGSTQSASDITEEILNEFTQVAHAEGIDLDYPEVLQHIKGTWSVPHYASMYQDLVKNHRLTEIDYINGAVWQKGKKHNIQTPYCKLITQLIHAKEDMNSHNITAN